MTRIPTKSSSSARVSSARTPLSPMLCLATQAAGPPLRRVLRWQVARLCARLAFLGLAARLAGAAIMGGPVEGVALALLVVCLALAAASGLLADAAAAHAEAHVSEAVEGSARRSLQAMSARRVQAIEVGTLIVALQRYPDAVAGLVVGHAAARRMMALGPLFAAAALAVVSWQAALLVLALTPVMIVFFALIGDLIRQRAQAQEAAFGHLAGQFADRVRTLPTILANHAVPSEAGKLQDRLADVAARTMDVLRIAFLNAAIIDFFASLSIAMLAVFLGLGHLRLIALPGFSDLQLWQSLFILMIAPDFFAPFRRFSEQYHAKAEGEAAALALDRLLDPPKVDIRPTFDAEALAATLPVTGLVAITGPSGVGKSTLLRALAGVDCEEDGAIPTIGDAGRICWIGIDTLVPGSTLAEAIAWPQPTLDPARLADVAARVGLGTDARLPAQLAPGGANLSGGQRLRISIARALLARGPVFADEPTAKLDPATAALVRSALQHMARTRLVIVATHDGALMTAADRQIALGDTGKREQAA